MKKLCEYRIVKTEDRYVIYDELTNSSVDVIPDTDEGQVALIQFLCENIINLNKEEEENYAVH